MAFSPDSALRRSLFNDLTNKEDIAANRTLELTQIVSLISFTLRYRTVLASSDVRGTGKSTIDQYCEPQLSLLLQNEAA